MAGLLPSFASGSNLAIYIGNQRVAYGSNLTFVDDVSHSAVGGIGGYSYDALEPTQYVARGSFSIVRYSDLAKAGIGKVIGTSATATSKASSPGALPSRVGATDTSRDGNSLLAPESFNPSRLMLSKTFDITVYEKGESSTLVTVLFTIKNVRMTGYSIGFTPGSVVSENISFMAILIEDNVVNDGVAPAQITI